MKHVNQMAMDRWLTTVGLILALLLGFSMGADAQNAATLLDKAATQYTESHGIKATFTLRTAGKGGGDQLEAAGIVGPFEGSKARQVLIQDEYSLEQLLNALK